MPWTPRQVRYLLSSGSPLSGGQQAKMKGELHASPGMGHMQKGSSALKKPGALGRAAERARANDSR